jgi:hypothetical protein
MTAKEKAKELVRRFYHVTADFDIAKQCAGIAVYEIIEFMSPMVNDKQMYDYWEEVRFEVYALGII